MTQPLLDHPCAREAPAGAESCCGGHGHSGHDHSGHARGGGPKANVEIEQATDPVCGMTVDPRIARHSCEHGGDTYYFCCAGCRTKFVADPVRYLHPEAVASAPGPAVAGVVHTCPMDPEVRQVGPGACPICGMALEPLLITAEAGPNHELADMTRRFRIGLALAIPVVVLDMSEHLAGLHGLVGGATSNWIQFLFATPVVIWCGWPFFVRGWASLLTRNLNMFTLVAMGTGVAWSYSVAATLAPAAIPAAFRGDDGAAAVYFEAAVLITVLVLLGQILELRARDSTSGAIRALLNLAPKTARRIRPDGREEEVALDEVLIGDRLRVRPGERMPADGVVIEGRSAVDESMVTGESMPVTRSVGDATIGGTLNGAGALVIEARAVGAGTMLSRVVQLVAEAQRSRAPIQRLADRVSGHFVPAVIAVALVAFAIWGVWGPEPRLAHGLVAAISVLIIACPCALGLATPMSIAVAMGRGAGMGLLIRNADALERLERVDTLVIDKTGTLTEGRPSLTEIVTAPGFTESDILALAASLERVSDHPLALAIVKEAETRGLATAAVTDVEVLAGKGAKGIVTGRAVAIGTAAFLLFENVDVASLATAAERLRADGATALFVGVDGRAAAALAIADPVRPAAAGALAALRATGMRIVMLTGDNRTTALAMARRLGIDEVEADILPEGKRAAVTRLREAGRVVAMAGDGVNDAPALAAADVGIAMGTGTDIAIESAGVTLLRGDLTGILRATTLARATMRNVRQNLAFAFLYNAAGVPIAAGVLYPVFGLLLSPVVAAAAMALSSLSVIGNAARLGRVRL